MDNNKRVAIITGGGQGIGKGTAKRLLQENYDVIIAEIDKEAGEEAEYELKDLGNIKFIHCDVSNEEDVKRLVEETIEKFRRSRCSNKQCRNFNK